MNLKKLGKSVLFPHRVLMGLLIPLSAVAMAVALVMWGAESLAAYLAYALSAYTLTVWCFRIPRLIEWTRSFRQENRYLRRWREDDRLRVNVSLYGTLAWNAVYGIFQLWLGGYHRTFWFCSLGIYYVLLAGMRFFLVRHVRTYRPGEQMREELIKYRACGWVFLFMNLALSLMVFFMVYWNRTFLHHEITTIAMAAYTFTAFTVAIVNCVKYRKFQSPVYSASKTISLAAACVSMLTLESTMLTTWGKGESENFCRIMLALTGAAVIAFVVVMAIYMILQGSRGLKRIRNEGKINNGREGAGL